MILSLLIFFRGLLCQSIADACESYRIGIILDEKLDSPSFRNNVDTWIDTCSHVTDVKRELIWLNSTVTIREDLDVLVSFQNHQGNFLSATRMALKYRKVGIPHISLSSYETTLLGDEVKDDTIHLGISSRLQSKLVHDLIYDANWESITLVLGQSTRHELRSRLLFDLSSNNIRIYPFVIKANEEELFCTFSNTPPNIVIIANYSEVITFSRRIGRLHKPIKQISLMLISDDFTLNQISMLKKNCQECRIYFVKFESSGYPDRIYMYGQEDIAFESRELTGYQLQIIDAIKLCMLIASSEDTLDHCRKMFSKNSPKGALQTLRRVAAERSHSFKIFRVKKVPPFSADLIGRWTTQGHIQGYDNGQIFDNVYTLGGRTLKVAVVPMNRVFVGRKDDETGTLEGLVIDLLVEIARSLEFKYEFVEPDDGLFGAPTDNGTWNGMIQMVLNGHADLAAGPITVSHQRAEVIDFTTPFIQQSVGILTPAARNSPQLIQFFRPYSVLVWILITVFIITTSLSLWMLAYMSHYQDNSPEHVNPSEYCMLVISSLFQQGPAFHPTSTSARCLLGFWLFFSVLVVAMYTAHLAAVQTVKTPTIPINSLQDVVNNEDITILVQYGTSIWTLFESSQIEMYQAVNKRKVPVKTMSEAADLVALGTHVFIGSRSPLVIQVAYGCGKVRLADERLFSGSYALMLPKDSPYKGAFNTKILSLVQSGIVNKWENKWLNPPSNCSEADEDSPIIRLSLETVGGLFIVYCISVAISIFILLIESSTKQCCQLTSKSSTTRAVIRRNKTDTEKDDTFMTTPSHMLDFDEI